MSQLYARIIARSGLAIDVPALELGEFGYDYDTKTLRVGDGTRVPARVLSDKAIGTFDMSEVSLTVKELFLVNQNSLVGGVAIAKLNLTDGLMVRYGDNNFKTISVLSGDDSLYISGGDGAESVLDVRLSSTLQAQLAEVYALNPMVTVRTNGSLLGDGTALDPLIAPDAGFATKGIIALADQTTLNDGSSNQHAVTPAMLASLTFGSNTAVALRSALGALNTVTATTSFAGAGTAVSPLALEPATTALRGGVFLADIADVEAALSNTKVITPYALGQMGYNSQMAFSLRRQVANNSDVISTILTADAQIHTLDASRVNEVYYNLYSKVEAGHDAYATAYLPSCTVQISAFVNGGWVLQDQLIVTAQGGGSGTTANLASIQHPKTVERNKFGALLWTPRAGTGYFVSTNNIVTSGNWDGRIRFNVVLNNGGNPSGLTVNTYNLIITAR